MLNHIVGLIIFEYGKTRIKLILWCFSDLFLHNGKTFVFLKYILTVKEVITKSRLDLIFIARYFILLTIRDGHIVKSAHKIRANEITTSNVLIILSPTHLLLWKLSDYHCSWNILHHITW